MAFERIRAAARNWPKTTRVVKVVTATSLGLAGGLAASELTAVGSQLLPALGALLGSGISTALIARNLPAPTSMPLVGRTLFSRFGVSTAVASEVLLEMRRQSARAEQAILTLAGEAADRHLKMSRCFLIEEPSIIFRPGERPTDRVFKVRLAEGGQAVTELLWNRIIHRVEVRKVFKATDAAQLQQTKREGRALAQLSDPHVPQVFAFEVQGESGSMALIMEFIPGVPLDKALKVTGGKLPLPLALKLFSELLTAFQVIHENNIIHRDVKPENILLVAAAQPGTPEKSLAVKIIDFGISNRADDTAFSIEGTPQYIAPEVWDKKINTPLSDIYSLGILFFELLTGHPPFNADGVDPNHPTRTIEFALEVIRKEPPSLLATLPLIPKVTDRLAVLITAMLAKEPADRPTAGQALSGLQAIAYNLNRLRLQP